MVLLLHVVLVSIYARTSDVKGFSEVLLIQEQMSFPSTDWIFPTTCEEALGID